MCARVCLILLHCRSLADSALSVVYLFFFFSCLEEECATAVTFVFPQVINLSCCCFNGIIYTVD